MYKIIILLFCLSAHSIQITQEERDFLNKIGTDESYHQKKISIPKLKFDYSSRKYKTNRFTATLKAGSVIQTLDGDHRYQVNSSTVLKAEEVTPGSQFSYLIDKDGNAKYVCMSKDLEIMNEVIRMNPKRYSFIKDNYEYKSTDLDKRLILNLLLTQGNHNYEIFEENETSSSYGLSAELGVESSVDYPMMLIANLTQLNSSRIAWSYVNLGMKVSRLWSYTQETQFGIFLQAETTLYGSAQFIDQRISLKENRFSFGPIVKWKDNIFSLEFAAERLRFPNTLELGNNSITNTEKYHQSLILKVGKQFEINL